MMILLSTYLEKLNTSTKLTKNTTQYIYVVTAARRTVEYDAKVLPHPKLSIFYLLVEPDI